MSDKNAIVETDDLVGAWLSMIDRAGDAWVPQKDLSTLPAGAAVQQDSETWCGIFFKPEFNPRAANPPSAIATHSATADTADIIRYDYRSKGLHLLVYETIDFVLLRIDDPQVDVLQLSQDKRAAGIAVAAAKFINVPSAVFQFPKSIEEGARFSTDAAQEPVIMPSWTSRIDGGIHADVSSSCSSKPGSPATAGSSCWTATTGSTARPGRPIELPKDAPRLDDSSEVLESPASPDHISFLHNTLPHALRSDRWTSVLPRWQVPSIISGGCEEQPALSSLTT